MRKAYLAVYDRLLLEHAWVTLAVVALVVVGFATQIPKVKLDASADSLMLQGDPSLDLFREVGREYNAEEFLLITWQPRGALLAPESLQPLRRMADELRALPGVSSVVTVWDVPLLESPRVSLSEITSEEPLPSLDDPGVDRELALREFTTSPIYADLLASRDGTVTAVQINLERDERYFELLNARDDLRRAQREGSLDASERERLDQLERDFKAHTAVALQRQSDLVAEVRRIAASYEEYADLFVGGVPMIAADMVAFVRSDLVTFGSSILVVMAAVLAYIFRRVRWVVIPLVTCSSTVAVMLGLLGALDWRMTVISSNFVAVLLIISLALSIHLIVCYRELHLADPEGNLHLRVLRTVRLMFKPCFFTAATTVVAFASLVVSGIQPVIDFGWMMTTGIAIALVLAFILVPCLMRVWPGGQAPPAHSDREPLSVRFARIADHRGKAVLLATGVLVLLTLWGISRLEVENRFIDYFHDSTEIYRGMELLDAKLGGTIPLDILLAAPAVDASLPGLESAGETGTESAPLAPDDEFAADADAGFADEPDGGFDDEWGGDDFDAFGGDSENFEPSYWFTLEGMRTLQAVHRHVESRPETGKVLSLATTFEVVRSLLGEDIGSVELALVQKSMPAYIRRLMVDPYFSADKEQARISVRVMETSRELRRDRFLRELRADLVGELGLAEDQVQLTGMLVLYNNVLQSLFRSQILTLGAVFLAIMVMFMIIFRSFWLALIALAPNVLAASLVLGIMGLVGIPLDIMTITIAAIVLGIGVDDCIHYVHRFKREFPRDRNYTATMYRCHNSIGRALYYTTITVIIGFSMLTMSNFNPSIYFGMLTVLAMAVAVIGALLLMPLLIVLFQPLGAEAEGHEVQEQGAQ